MLQGGRHRDESFSQHGCLQMSTEAKARFMIITFGTQRKSTSGEKNNFQNIAEPLFQTFQQTAAIQK